MSNMKNPYNSRLARVGARDVLSTLCRPDGPMNPENLMIVSSVNFIFWVWRPIQGATEFSPVYEWSLKIAPSVSHPILGVNMAKSCSNITTSAIDNRFSGM